jgi:hypothetical protein
MCTTLAPVVATPECLGRGFQGVSTSRPYSIHTLQLSRTQVPQRITTCSAALCAAVCEELWVCIVLNFRSCGLQRGGWRPTAASPLSAAPWAHRGGSCGRHGPALACSMSQQATGGRGRAHTLHRGAPTRTQAQPPPTPCTQGTFSASLALTHTHTHTRHMTHTYTRKNMFMRVDLKSAPL